MTVVSADTRPVLNIYCDESCHLEHDHQEVMVLGALWCPAQASHLAAKGLRDLKAANGLAREYELKWVKVSQGKVGYYLGVLRYFFNNHDLHFRALVVPDKAALTHRAFSQTHDEWYYKMYFDLLKVILSPGACNHIYLDIKDTRGGAKVRKLHEVLCNNAYDFKREIIDRVQIVESKHVELMQLADLLIGAVSYANRHLADNPAKVSLVQEMRTLSGLDLQNTTLLREEKVNIFRWRARVARA